MTAFTSRQFLIHNDFEEVSLRDTVLWKIENPGISLGQVQLSFRIDLYCRKKPTASFYQNDGQTNICSSIEEESDLNEQDEVGISKITSGETTIIHHPDI